MNIHRATGIFYNMTSPPPSYARISSADVPVSLLQEIYGTDPAFLQMWKDSIPSGETSIWMGALVEEEIVGFTVIGLGDVYGREVMLSVGWFAVNKEHQGKHIGSELLALAIDEARDQWTRKGYTVRSITTETEHDNAPALSVYRSVFQSKGFKVQEHLVKNAWANDSMVILFAIREPVNQ